MDIIAIAEENFFISFLLVFVVGLLQGAILGRGIRKKFPKLKIHAKAVSAILLILFSINAIFSIIKFADPQKVSFSEIKIPLTPEDGISFLFNIMGLNAGLGTVIVVFISISLILFFKFADIPNIGRYFIFTISLIMLLVSGLARFTDYVPSLFQVAMYAFYQFGLTLGIFFVTRRKSIEELPEA